MLHNAQSVALIRAQGIRKEVKKPVARRSGKHGPLRPFRAFSGQLRSNYLKVKWVNVRDRYGGRAQFADQGRRTAHMTNGTVMVHACRGFCFLTGLLRVG
jgi:hypothetical protein